MTAQDRPAAPPGQSPHRTPSLALTPGWAAGLLALASLPAYSNSFSGTFTFDDNDSILGNPSITRLWPLPGPLSPPANLTVGGRPIYNLTLAINYALTGFNVGSYHLFNLLVHLLAAFTLLGIVRRTLLLPLSRSRFGESATYLAFCAALLWMLHPVLTICVTYISQRSESLMSLFYLLTLYAFIRSATETARPWLWPVLAVTACYLGMMTKEVMATAPLIVLLYDRTFLAGSFREAWRRRWRLHTALMAGWLLLIHAFLDVAQRPIGTGHGVGPWDYALTECRAILHYLLLAAWPHPLALDYGANFATSPLQVLPQALVVLTLLAATAIALVRWPVAGFIGAWFFIILAPTSSFIPVPKAPIGDNRLYLPLMAFVVPLVLGLQAWLGRKSVYAFTGIAVIWGTLTFLRNNDFENEVTLWHQTIEACPANPQAYSNYGEALVDVGRYDEAVEAFQQAVQLQPDFPEALVNLGFALAQLGRPMDSISCYQQALRLRPGFADAQNNWANALAQLHQYKEAIPHYLEAIRLQPGYAVAHYNCGNMYLKLDQLPEGFAQYEEALREKPDFFEVRYNWGNVLLNHGRVGEAVAQYREALRINPQFLQAHNNLGMALAQLGDRQGALAEFQAALQIDPNFAPAMENLLRYQANPAPVTK